MPKTVSVPGVGVVEFPDTMSDEEMSSHVKELAQPQPSDPLDKMLADFRKNHPIMAAPLDALMGVGAGLTSTGVGAYDLARKIPGAASVLPEVSPTMRQATVPPGSWAGNTGKFLEQAAEYMIPGSLEAEALMKLPAWGRIAAEAANAGGVGALQSGGDPMATAMAAATGGITRGIGEGAVAGLKSALGPLVNKAPFALAQDAVALARKESIPLDQAALTGSPQLARVQRLLGSTFAPDQYEELVKNQQGGLNRVATGLASNGNTDMYSAGQKAINSLSDVFHDETATGRKAYADLQRFKDDPANTVTYQTGRMIPDPNGRINPISGDPFMVPETRDVAMPVDMRPVKEALQPLFDRLTGDNAKAGLTILASSPQGKAVSALQSIINGEDFIPADAADMALSNLKRIQSKADILNGGAQGKYTIGKIIDQLSPAVNEAVEYAGKDAKDALENGRAAWAKRYQALDMLDRVGGSLNGKTDQVAVANHLTAPKDAHYGDLENVLQFAPTVKDDLAEAAMNKVFEKTLTEEGKYTSPLTAANNWNAIGDRTKEALFSPEHIADVDAFMKLAKRISQNPNPSGTGAMNAAMAALGVLKDSGLALSHGNVLKVAQTAGTVLLSKELAKLMLNPEGATALKTLIGSPAGSMDRAISKSVIRSLLEESAEKVAEPEPVMRGTITKPAGQ